MKYVSYHGPWGYNHVLEVCPLVSLKSSFQVQLAE